MLLTKMFLHLHGLLTLFTATFYISLKLAKTEPITGIRLLDQSGKVNPSHGRVELQLDYKEQQWYGICEKGSNDLTHHSWNRMSAVVACRQLGFMGGWNYSVKGVSTRYTLEDFRCESDYDTLDRCFHDDSELCGCAPSNIFSIFSGCNYDEHSQQNQAAVDCYDVSDIDFRLVHENARQLDGSKNSHGKLEVMFRNSWYDVCHRKDGFNKERWTRKEAKVACRQLGFELGAIETRRLKGNMNNRPSSIANFKCIGNEKNLFACLPDRPRNVSCGDDNQVYVKCNVSDQDKTSATSMTTSSGIRPSSQNVTNWYAAVTVIGALLFVAIIICGVMFVIFFLKKKMKQSGHPNNGIELPTIAGSNHTYPADLYAELEEQHHDDYNYAYTDVNTRPPSVPCRELLTSPEPRYLDLRHSEGWVDNTAYVPGTNDADNDDDDTNFESNEPGSD